MPTELLETNGYTEWITVKWKRKKTSYVEYEFHFKIDGRAAIFYGLTRLDKRTHYTPHEVMDKEPSFMQDEVIDEIIENYPELQPITDWREFETPTCLQCESDLLYKDDEEEYFCPWCNNEN